MGTQGLRGEGTHFSGHLPCLLIPLAHGVFTLNFIPTLQEVHIRFSSTGYTNFSAYFPLSIVEGSWVQATDLGPRDLQS